MDAALKSGLLKGNDGFKWGAIGGVVSGGANRFFAQNNLPYSIIEKDVRKLKDKTKWPENIIKKMHSAEEALVYINAQVKPALGPNGDVYFLKDIDWSRTDSEGRTNFVRVDQYGLPPLDPDGLSYEVHFIGQNGQGPFVMLTRIEHRRPSVSKKIHDSANSVNCNDDALAQQREEFWKTVLQMQTGGVAP